MLAYQVRRFRVIQKVKARMPASNNQANCLKNPILIKTVEKASRAGIVIDLFVGSAFTASIEVAIQGRGTVIDGVPVPEPALGMILTLLPAICLGGHKQKVVDVVVALQGAFRPSYDTGRTFSQVVAKQGLFLVAGLEIFIIATVHVMRARLFALICIAYKSLDVHSVFPKKHT
jgi:hypothetical protein